MNMLKSIFKSALPHIIAIAIFAVVATIYCKPALEGKVLQQQDIAQWKGMAHDAMVYAEKNGQHPLWTNSMFGGMPTYQITGVPGFAFTIGLIDNLLTLHFPEPINLFFLACLCFYFLAQVLGFNNIISIIGALAYSYATYNPIIVTVGHITKMHAIAYLPFFIAAILLIFQKKYLWGAVLTGIATALFVGANHIQITYYGLIIVAFMSIFFLVKWIKEKNFNHILKTFAAACIGGLLGVAVNAPLLASTYEYGKESIRGGSVLVNKDSKTTATGLNKDYAFTYSMFKTEPLVLMFSGIYGGSSGLTQMDPANSKAVETLQQMPPQIGQQLQGFVSLYWGGIGGTSGPPYAGLVICLFALIGLSSSTNPHRWWMTATIIFACMLSAGSYFEAFNVFMYNHLPLYNKFRAPSMIMIIPTLLLGVMALYGMAAISVESDFKTILNKYKPSFILTGLILATVFYI